MLGRTNHRWNYLNKDIGKYEQNVKNFNNHVFRSHNASYGCALRSLFRWLPCAVRYGTGFNSRLSFLDYKCF